MSDETEDSPAPGSELGVELYREYWGRGEEILAYRDEEKEHNRRRFGQTWREVNGRDHKRCIILCLNPGQRKPVRCPCCYGNAGFVPIDEMPGIEPLPTRAERLAAWLGTLAAAFWDAVTLPARVSQEHRIALIRDVLQDAMAAGLTAEIVQVCPECDEKEAANGLHRLPGSLRRLPRLRRKSQLLRDGTGPAGSRADGRDSRMGRPDQRSKGRSA
jgi:hypothetical protein